MSMSEILEVMVGRARMEAEDAQRVLLAGAGRGGGWGVGVGAPGAAARGGGLLARAATPAPSCLALFAHTQHPTHPAPPRLSQHSTG